MRPSLNTSNAGHPRVPWRQRKYSVNARTSGPGIEFRCSITVTQRDVIERQS